MLYEISWATAMCILPLFSLEMYLWSRTNPVATSSAGFKTNARPLARGELKSIRASGLPDMTSPAG